MPNRWRSSFFYFFFPILGGTFASLLMAIYYSWIHKSFGLFRLFYIKSIVLMSILQWTLYASVAQQLMAPYTLSDLLNNHRPALGSSLLGLLFATSHLYLHRRRLQQDLLVFVGKEWPLVPNLLCCALGGLINIAFVSVVYFWYYLL
jgi:hypothetical protein